MTDNKAAGKIILAFVSLLIGIFILATSANQGNELTGPLTVVNETFDLTSLRMNSKGNINQSLNASAIANRCALESGCILTYTMYNVSGTIINTGNYSLEAARNRVTILNTSTFVNYTTSNTTFLNYTYYKEGYLTDSWARTVINSNSGLFAIALLLIAVGLFYSIAKDYDLV